jgi:hypothetical protein
VRHLRIALAVAVLAGSFSLLGLVAPGCAYACSCIQPQPIGTYVDQPDTMVLTGTVVAMDASQRGTFHVDRWYQGSSEVSDIPIRGGDGANCGIPLTLGQELVMVAFVTEGFLQPSICSPWADLSTPEGQQLRDETIEAFGEGTVPDDATAPGEPMSGDRGGFAVPWIVVIGGGAVALVVVIIAAASIVSSRRES